MAPGFEKLQESLGISDEAIAKAVDIVGLPAYMSHVEFHEQAKTTYESRGNFTSAYSNPTDCGGVLRIVDRDGAMRYTECDVCGFKIGVNMRTSDPERLQAELLEAAGIPAKYLETEFERGQPGQEEALKAVRIWVKHFDQQPLPGVALYGKPGRGKTHLLALLAQTLIKRHGVETLYRSEAQLFEEIQGVDPEAEYRWKRALNVPVLAIDDLGAGRQTDFRRDRLQALVDYRYSQELPMIIATNIHPGGWVKVFGERAASRLRGMVLPFELGGVDRRELPQTALFTPPAESSDGAMAT
jgi:DNA replication protein DnaC